MIFAGNDLVLDGDGCRGAGWQFRNIDPNDLTLETVDSIPGQFVGGGWSYIDGVWTGNAIADQVILPAKRAEKIAQFTALATAANFAAIEYLGHTWRADSASQGLLAQVLAIGSVPENMYWRDSSDTPHAMTYADLQGLGAAILARGLAADNNLMTKTAAVNEATTAEGIDAIAW
ncbi:DUF4376 domain-containing protein [Nitrosomonas sp. Is79A3]|uniref:DUF4376 domain-containing protein n=1 Tax=Nitrosomonas sp. (strain Is79A3) TaxID=261292 RepID=UPI0018DE426A